METPRHRVTARRVALVVIAAGAFAAAAARANGAFPDEFSIHFPQNAPDRILVGANFGMMASEDRGATWRYVCEPWVTTGSSDPLAVINVIFYQVTADGSVLANTTNGALNRSADGGCTWTRSGGAIDGAAVTDFFPSPTDPSFVIAVTTPATGSSLWGSHDGGKTFEAPALYSASVLITSAEIAKTAPATIYATVSGAGVAKLLRSADSGQTWVQYDVPAVNGVVPQPRILAIDPDDADTVYLRLLGPPYDAIAIATAGGQTIQIALAINGVFSAFARGSDKMLYAGTPDSKLYVRPPQGSFGASIPGARFRCLGQRTGAADLYACADMFQDGFSVGLSRDAGKSFQKVMKLPELQGLLTCAPVQSACAAHWARIQTVFAADAGPPSTDGGGGTSPSSGGHCSSAGAGPLAGLALVAFALRRRRTLK
jgi:photosystem II stability/assembly factor-like uncharacterized protein